jgi:hypothetical protein
MMKLIVAPPGYCDSFATDELAVPRFADAVTFRVPPPFMVSDWATILEFTFDPLPLPRVRAASGA